ncbi:4-hydroxy-tetrahydrodipicolinate synthase [Sphingomonas prati]|uniref:4-hydroxy-tetrahydrodipicolinate synthase n=1 Tax=Sphingomonas prati TaxID=1843237 RepID=A0A7W9BQL9_9SPHN|nr:4-hydroxy-tetrahydrodipicolinate synthase [Sphingomonas prati]MBB5728200.1 4-hydroxy-tetrahydrodipicolinate synthase [Sphingomonas prati]GGE75631.1 4-hydroxy-tetrahydrodipicolinate synthase [Sphingomonas prati]
MFRGSIPALVTPFRDGAFDEGTYRKFIDLQIESGSSALVPCGTTGESATMTIVEHDRVVSVCVEQAAGRVPVIAGCGSNDTRVALEHMRAAQRAGAAAALLVPPYYNRPSQAGIIAHFEALAEGCDLPIMLYNVPGRTSVDIHVDTMARLAAMPSVIGVKDATGNAVRVTAQRLACGTDFCQLSGNDDMALGFMAMGGLGCISVTANVAPALCAEFQDACLEGRWGDALALQDKLFPLHTALFSDASPGPVKYALSRVLSDFPSELRLPMTEPSAASRAQVDAALLTAGLL